MSVSSYHTKTGYIKSCANLTGRKWWLICFIFIFLTRSKTDYPLFSMNWLTLCLWQFFYWIGLFLQICIINFYIGKLVLSNVYCKYFFLALLIAFKFLCGILFDRIFLKIHMLYFINPITTKLLLCFLYTQGIRISKAFCICYLTCSKKTVARVG